MGGGGGGSKTPVSTTQVSRSTEPGSTATRRGEKRRLPTSMFQARKETAGSAFVFGGTKPTLG